MVFDEITEILKKCAIFSELSDMEVKSVAELGRIETFEPGDIIHEQGRLGTKLYVLSEGQVSLERKINLGNSRWGKITVFVLRNKSNRRLMGAWSSLVGEEHVQMCTAVCNTPTQIVSIDCSELRGFLLKNPVIRIKLLEKLVLLLRDRIDRSYEAMETL
ncbi:MAG: cyclic nucleotide-binding domain-containing protein [Pseudomonadota bacterium]